MSGLVKLAEIFNVSTRERRFAMGEGGVCEAVVDWCVAVAARRRMDDPGDLLRWLSNKI